MSFVPAICLHMFLFILPFRITKELFRIIDASFFFHDTAVLGRGCHNRGVFVFVKVTILVKLFSTVTPPMLCCCVRGPK